MIAFIGSGPHNLAVLAFLLKANPSLRSEIRVFDPSGSWLTRWNRQMEGQGIVHLRSSSVHHPDPDPMALRRFAKGRFDEFYPPYYLPGTGLFREFCEDLLERLDVKSLVEARKVERVEPEAAGMRVHLDNGEVAHARVVVAALGGGERVWPNWAPPSSAPTLVHSEDVDLRELVGPPGRLALVGGGLTAGHLALGALERGWRVDLLTRRPVTYKLFDAAPGWIGPKHLAGYLLETDFRKRRKMIARARGGGAMTEEIREALLPFRKSGQLTLRSGIQVKALRQEGEGWKVDYGWGRALQADRVWLCTGNRLDLASHPLFDRFATRYPLQTIDGLPVLEADCRWPGLPLYLMGAAAALRVGPTARNFPGARQAASRITKAITGIYVPPN